MDAARSLGRAHALPATVLAGRSTAVKSSLLTEISDSDLPYKVDLVDWRNVNDLWRETTGAELVALLEGPAP